MPPNMLFYASNMVSLHTPRPTSDHTTIILEYLFGLALFSNSEYAIVHEAVALFGNVFLDLHDCSGCSM